jgi:hypothetical protein
MKSLLIRVFVLSLAVVGFTASSISSQATTTASAKASHGTVLGVVGSVPLCAPSDPTHCGLD